VEAALRSAQEMVKQAKARLGQAQPPMANAQITPKQIPSRGSCPRRRSQALKAKAPLNRLSSTSATEESPWMEWWATAAPRRPERAGRTGSSLARARPKTYEANFKVTQLDTCVPARSVSIKVDALAAPSCTARSPPSAAPPARVTALLPPENATGNYVKVVQRIPVRIDFDDANKQA